MRLTRRCLALVLVGLICVAGTAGAHKDIFVARVSYPKAERAVARAHLQPGPKAFVLGRLKQAIATTTPGRRSMLRIQKMRGYDVIALAHGPEHGAQVTQIILPRAKPGAKATAIVHEGVLFAGGVLTKRLGKGHLIDENGTSSPTSHDDAWGWGSGQ